MRSIRTELRINVSSSSYSCLVMVFFRVGSLLNLQRIADFFSTASVSNGYRMSALRTSELSLRYIYAEHLLNYTDLFHFSRVVFMTKHEFSTRQVVVWVRSFDPINKVFILLCRHFCLKEGKNPLTQSFHWVFGLISDRKFVLSTSSSSCEFPIQVVHH